MTSKIPAGLILLFIVALFVLAPVACVVVPGASAPGDSSVLIPRDGAELLRWVDQATPVLVTHFGLAESPETRLSVANPPALYKDGVPYTTSLGQHYRRPGRDLILIMSRDRGGDLPAHSMKMTWLHEFLHHLDVQEGRGYPNEADHNAEFDKRINDLNLVPLTWGL